MSLRLENAVSETVDVREMDRPIDLPPEYCRYRDEGCELAVSCLNCPFPTCINEEPGGRRRWLKGLRAREMARLYLAEGKGVRELAAMFGVSERTVQRALKVVLPNRARREQRDG